MDLILEGNVINVCADFFSESESELVVAEKSLSLFLQGDALFSRSESVLGAAVSPNLLLERVLAAVFLGFGVRLQVFPRSGSATVSSLLSLYSE